MILLEFFKVNPLAWTWQEMLVVFPMSIAAFLLATATAWSLDKLFPGVFTKPDPPLFAYREITVAGFILCMLTGLVFGAVGHIATVYFF